MTYDQFITLGSPISDLLWAHLLAEDLTCGQPRAAFTEFAPGFIMHTDGDYYYPHAWWYSPAPYADKAKAQQSLYEWYLELND